MIKIRLRIVFVLLSAFFALSVFAETPEHDGYLLSFKDDKAKQAALEYIDCLGTLMGEDYNVSPVFDMKNIYKAYNEDLIAVLYQMGFLEYYEPNIIGYLMEYDYTLDPHYSDQIEWAHRASKAPEAWRYGVYGNEVTVAYIDSGIKTDHEDLSSSILTGYSYVDKNGDGNLTDDETSDYTDSLGHGTRVAGVIAAQANGKGVVGVAHRAKLIPIKITDQGSFSTAELASAVNKAVDLGADVINMSLGVGSRIITLENAIKDAQAKGVIVVAASGNTSSYTQGTAVYPAYSSNVISVGNLTHSGYTYSVSGGSIANAGVTIVAPGTMVHTASQSYSSTYGGYYTTATGTSFSSPYVAGIAALAKSVDPNITPDEFMQILIDTADKSLLPEGQTRTNALGYGIADAGAVVRYMISQREKGGFISPVDKTSSGAVNVKIHNPGNTQMTYSFAAKTENSGRPISFAYKTVTLAPGAVKEISLSSLNGALASEISCFLFDATKFSPVYRKIEG